MRGWRTLLMVLGLSSGCSQSEDAPRLDLDRADEKGVEGTLVVDGEEIRISATDAASTDPEYQGDQRIITVSGADEMVHAGWTINLADTEIIGHFAGHEFGLDAERDMDLAYWAALQDTRTATILDAVSRSAAAAREANPQAADHLYSLSQLGPYLRKMAAPRAGTIDTCGDGVCDADEDDESCAEDCGCTATACDGVAPMGCYCDETCLERGDCCADACDSCGDVVAGCPTCDGYHCVDGACIAPEGECNGAIECLESEDDEGLCGDSAVAARAADSVGRGFPGQTLALGLRPDSTECHYRLGLRKGRRLGTDCYWKYFVKSCMRDIECGDRTPFLKIWRYHKAGKRKFTDKGAPHGGFLCETVSERLWMDFDSVVVTVKAWMSYDPGVYQETTIHRPRDPGC